MGRCCRLPPSSPPAVASYFVLDRHAVYPSSVVSSGRGVGVLALSPAASLVPILIGLPHSPTLLLPNFVVLRGGFSSLARPSGFGLALLP